ncbi:MAG: ABC transporter ATP-binding protein [Chloroflexota bacterium]
MIHATQLTKSYHNTLALDNLTLTVPRHAIFALLGPNGSGKSTFLRLLMQFIFPDAGSITLQNLSLSQIGYVPERALLPLQVKVEEYMMMMGQLANMHGQQLTQAVDHHLAQVGLADEARRHIHACSKGMRQRLALAAALLSDVPLLVLDEPMSGLDPAAQHQIRQLILAAHSEGKTILFSTHQLADVHQLCTHIAILNRAKLMQTGTLAEVLPLRNCVTIQTDNLPTKMIAELTQSPYPIRVANNTITLIDDAITQKSVILQQLLNAHIDITSVQQERSTLEEVYLAAIK